MRQAVWLESSLIACAFYSLRATQRGMYQNPCHTGGMHRLIWILTGHTGLIVSFVVHWLIYILANRGVSKTSSTITKTHLFKYTENFTSKNWKFSDKKKSFFFFFFFFFHISAQDIDYGYSLEPPRRGGSNEYPQNMFLSRIKKNNVYPFKPQFYYIKEVFKVVKIILGMFSWWEC